MADEPKNYSDVVDVDSEAGRKGGPNRAVVIGIAIAAVIAAVLCIVCVVLPRVSGQVSQQPGSSSASSSTTSPAVAPEMTFSDSWRFVELDIDSANAGQTQEQGLSTTFMNGFYLDLKADGTAVATYGPDTVSTGTWSGNPETSGTLSLSRTSDVEANGVSFSGDYTIELSSDSTDLMKLRNSELPGTLVFVRDETPVAKRVTSQHVDSPAESAKTDVERTGKVTKVSRSTDVGSFSSVMGNVSWTNGPAAPEVGDVVVVLNDGSAFSGSEYAFAVVVTKVVSEKKTDSGFDVDFDASKLEGEEAEAAFAKVGVTMPSDAESAGQGASSTTVAA